MKRVLICGSRHYSDYRKILEYVRGLQDAVIISGGAKGADTLAVMAARACGLQYCEYPADWEKYGKRAGPIRNQLMLDIEKPSLVVAFHPDIEGSRGTKDMVSRARRASIPILVFS